ncbi:hypothetical protein M9H77_29923 [Catharanthus roseus]|uniref:Uncharacterized protein n=1 Tax=Catharanthus roseus TaxID=4058 RepID=A0ACB9ZW60_CATRO|nr:hypothetical protein M9H77_29923 [Catharanthus roseus]
MEKYSHCLRSPSEEDKVANWKWTLDHSKIILQATGFWEEYPRVHCIESDMAWPIPPLPECRNDIEGVPSVNTLSGEYSLYALQTRRHPSVLEGALAGHSRSWHAKDLELQVRYNTVSMETISRSLDSIRLETDSWKKIVSKWNAMNSCNNIAKSFLDLERLLIMHKIRMHPKFRVFLVKHE